MEKKRCKVVMLPTDKAENCIIKRQNGISSSLHYQKTLLTQDYLKNGDGVIGFPKTSHHLYFVNDEDIATGDWVLFSDVVMIAKSFDDRVVHDGKGNSFMKGDCHKVIATTDPELRSDGLIEDPNNPKDNLLIRKGLPQPSQAFIEEYCRKGGIDEVDVEYIKEKSCESPHCDDLCDACEEFKPKVDSNNCIIIHPIKDTYTRDEVEQLCVSAYEDGFYEGTKKDSPCKDPVFWLKENL
jgi:hypothetical protein